MSDDDVGYGKPPKSGQFKKGQSGNPRGRPRGAKNLKTIVNETLSAKVKAKEGGKIKSVSKLEGIILNQANKALSGDPKAAAQILNLAEAYLPAEDATEGSTPVLTADDLAVLEDRATFLEIIDEARDHHDDEPD